MMALKTVRMGISLVALALLVGAGCAGPTPTYREEAEELVAPTADDFRFVDDFVHKHLDGWTVGSGTWRSGRGVLTLWGRGTGHDTREEIKTLTLASLPPRDCRIEVDLRFLSEPRGEAFAGILFRYRDPFNYYWFRFCDFEQYQDRVEIYKFYKGERDLTLGAQPITFNPFQWYRLAVEVEGPALRAYLDGKEVIDVTDADLDVGTAGLAVKKTAKVEFRRFRVLSL